MLRISVSSNNSDTCDYCRKRSGEEIVYLDLTGKSWHDRNNIQIHTKCLTRSIEKYRQKHEIEDPLRNGCFT